MNRHNSFFFKKALLLSAAILYILLAAGYISGYAWADDDVKAAGGMDENWRGKIYWAIWGEKRIAQADYNGTNRKIFARTGSGPDGLVVDLKSGIMYWTNMGVREDETLDGSIQQCRMEDCLNTTLTIVEPGKTATPKQLALDRVNGYIYWSDRDRNLVQRSRLDGSAVETVIILKDKSRIAPVGCEIDEEDSVLYWSEKDSNRIGRIRLTEVELPYEPEITDYIVTHGLNGPCEIKTDKNRNMIFIAERYSSRISRVSLSGGTPTEVITTGKSQPVGLALDRIAGKIFISELLAHRLSVVNMDGTEFKKISDNAGRYPTGMFFVPVAE